MSNPCPSSNNPTGLCLQGVPDKARSAKKVERKVVCPDCKGVGGRFEGADDCCFEGCCNVTCATCGGTGEVWRLS
ncbi:MAG: hypothetical protein HQL53_11780 [Magnetococcales bacterium]|nr:hypothetical protein [Magnetococcales bacterium]